MARGDRRGPQGMGPMTGRGLGYCAGNDRPGFQVDDAPMRRNFNGGGGRGFGRGRGFGNGFGQGYGRGFGPAHGRGFGGAYQEPPFEAQDGLTSSLADEIIRLKEQLQALETRLAEQNQKD